MVLGKIAPYSELGTIPIGGSDQHCVVSAGPRSWGKGCQAQRPTGCYLRFDADRCLKDGQKAMGQERHATFLLVGRDSYRVETWALRLTLGRDRCYCKTLC